MSADVPNNKPPQNTPTEKIGKLGKAYYMDSYTYITDDTKLCYVDTNGNEVELRIGDIPNHPNAPVEIKDWAKYLKANHD